MPDDDAEVGGEDGDAKPIDADDSSESSTLRLPGNLDCFQLCIFPSGAGSFSRHVRLKCVTGLLSRLQQQWRG